MGIQNLKSEDSIPAAFLTAENASCCKLASSLPVSSLVDFLVVRFFLYICFTPSKLWLVASTSFSITDQTPWVTELNSSTQFSFLESTRKTVTLEIGHPSVLGTSFDAFRLVDISQASMTIFSVAERWFSRSSNSPVFKICISFICDNRLGFRTTANLQNGSKPRNSSCWCCFLW